MCSLTNKLRVVVGSTTKDITVIGDLITGKLYHVCLVRDKTNLLMKTYVNGILKDSSACSISTNVTASIKIGSNSSTGDFAKSITDEIAIFNRELSANEIKQLYDSYIKN
jgi:hypothetical protein